MGSNPTPGIYNQNPALLSAADFRRYLVQRYRVSTADSTIKRIRFLMKGLNKTDLAGLVEMQREVADYVLQLAVSPGTKHNYLTAYLQLLHYAFTRPDPYVLDAYATVDRLRPRKRPLVPSYQTCQAAVGACRNSRFRTIIALCLYGGLRLNEARQLRWSQVDLPNRTIVLEEAEKRSEGSTLPIPDALAAILQSTPRREDDPYIARIAERSAWRCMTFLKRRLMRAGFNDAVYLSFKNLRHVFATYHYARTKDLHYVQRMMRHRSLSSTIRYIHMTVESRTYDVRAVDAADKQTILELLTSGYEHVVTAKNIVYLRRPRL